MSAQVRTQPKYKHPGYLNESDEIGRQTPSTETRPLFAVAFLDLTQHYPYPIETDCRHSVDRAHARVEHVMWEEARGRFHGVHYQIIDVAQVFGYFAKDEHGDHLTTHATIRKDQ